MLTRDSWLAHNPADSDPSCTRGKNCRCDDCEWQRMLADLADAPIEQGVSPRMAMRRRRDEK